MDYNRRLPINEIYVIDRDNDFETQGNRDIYDFSSFDYFTYIAIGFIYAFLVSLLVNRILNYERVEKVCDVGKEIKIDDPQRNARGAACRKAVDEYDSKKFFYMIIIGVVSMLGGGYLARSDPRYMTGGLGVALGGLMTIIYFTI